MLHTEEELRNLLNDFKDFILLQKHTKYNENL